MTVFIDSDIPMYVAGRTHPNREPSLRFLEKVRSGAVEGVTSTEVLQEILFRYSALGQMDVAYSVYDLFAQLCAKALPVTLADTARHVAPRTPSVRSGGSSFRRQRAPRKRRPRRTP